VTEKVKSGATYDDIVASPEDRIAEVVGGDLYFTPRPSMLHANAASALGADLHGAFQRGRSGTEGWWIVDEPELRLADDVVVPDIAGWRREKLSELPSSGGVSIVPDWVCEVLSPSTEKFDRTVKVPLYAARGVEFVWLVDLANRTVEVLRLEEAELRLVEKYSGNATVSAPPFEEVSIDLASLWG
jgi:Uma2 family endonuclease